MFGYIAHSFDTIFTNMANAIFGENDYTSLCPRGDDTPLRLFFEQSAFVNEKHAWECRAYSLPMTLRVLRYIRDVRHRGDRESFFNAFEELYDLDVECKVALLDALPDFVDVGRWKDLVELYARIDEHMFRQEVLEMFAVQLKEDIESPVYSNAAKWVPTENHGIDKECGFTSHLASYMGVTNRQLRKEYLTPLRAAIDIPERQMCANEWNNVNYSQTPKTAIEYNSHAFQNHDGDRFRQHLDMSFTSEPIRDLTFDDLMDD